MHEHKRAGGVSVLFNEPKLLKSSSSVSLMWRAWVSVLFNEPKLLKSSTPKRVKCPTRRFSALQRAEIAEMSPPSVARSRRGIVSVLFNEPKLLKFDKIPRICWGRRRFSALQRAEIAEIYETLMCSFTRRRCFSALQRAEIAEILLNHRSCAHEQMFQCSSTSRNC